MKSDILTMRSVEEAIGDLLCYIEDFQSLRPGLIDTPNRVARSYLELFDGYNWSYPDIKKMMTTFDGVRCDTIVLCKDIEFYSFCEHHMLPFTGKAHVAYIPGRTGDDYRVVGLSKLSRLVDVFAHRLQMQENIGVGVVDAMEEFLKPLGCACVLTDVKHFCMCARGVGKQHSTVSTSAMKGTFLTGDGTSRLELMQMIFN